MKPRDYLADTAPPMSLRAFLEAALVEQTSALPALYANTTRAFSGRAVGGSGLVHISAGDRVRVAYDPDDPTDAVILSRLPWRLATAVFLVVAALVSLFTGGLMLLGARLPWVAR